MTMNDSKRRQIIQDLQQAYIPNEPFKSLQSRFELLLDQRRADIASGIFTNVRGIVLVGDSGSGKSTAIRELLRKTKDHISFDPNVEEAEFISLQVPSPATLKFVGTATLHALGYPLARDKSVALIWGLVKEHLRRRKTLFLHLDEAQDLTRYQTEHERASVVRTLKSLMENSSWPVGLILTGMPELKSLINQDTQLARRLYPIEIARLHPVKHAKPIVTLLSRYCERAGVAPAEPLMSRDFAERLLHAGDYQFGLVAELIVQAISDFLFSGGEEGGLSITHFANVYHMRSGSIDGLNPFVSEMFRQIDVRLLLDEPDNLECAR